MLKALFRVRLATLKSWLNGASRSKEAKSKGSLVGFTLLMLFSFASLGFMFWHIFDTIALPFHLAGLDWLYFAMTALMNLGLMFVGSVFVAKAQLYEAKDNDLLLSMPIKPWYILLSRMFMLWVVNLFFGLITAIPALIAWSGAVGFTGAGLAFYLVEFLLLTPLLALTLSALFGWLLHLLTARTGNKPFVTVLFSLLLMGLYMYWSFRMNSLITAMADNAEGIAGNLGAVAPLVWLGRAAAEGSLPLLLRTALLILLGFALACVLLGKTFLRAATARHGAARKQYVARTAEALSPRRALLRREWQRFAALPSYILNCGLGAFMALVAAVALIVKRQSLLALPYYDYLAPTLQLLFLLGLCFCAATVLITAPSISLEGKTLWIVKSLPLEARELLQAKLRLQLLVGVPPILLASLVVALVMRARGLMLLSMLALPAVFVVFAGLLGLVENLRHPNFNWVNEMQAVKSGMSILLTMFICWGVLLVPVLAYLFWGDVISGETLALALLGLLILASLLLYRLLMRRGAAMFREL